MVGSASSLRSFSPSIAADVGPARVLKGAASALVPRRIGWTSRAVRIRARAQAHHPGLMPTPAHPINNSTDSLSSGRPTSDLDPAPHTHAHAAAATTRAPSSSVPVLAITCGAVGGIIALAVVLALVYVRRIRRRVKSMKRRTNVLGPGARFLDFYGFLFIYLELLLFRTRADVAVPVIAVVHDRLTSCQI